MKPQPGIAGRLLKWGVVVVVLAVVLCAFRFVLGRPSFDADKVARAETRMWQAYYGENQAQLALQLVAFLRGQHGLSLWEAKEAGELLARSAMKFRSAGGDYDNASLPELIQAYSLIQRAVHARFDPEQVARAELAWWVARRTQGQNSAEQVGDKIARLYGLLYGKDHQSFLKAGVLRAQAAALRDSGGNAANWEEVGDLLQKSYRELKKAL